MTHITRILCLAEAGDPRAAEQLLPLVYDELRALAAARMAGERPDHTLQATALVHEAFLRLVGSAGSWQSRGQFFAAAANSMRQILVNYALAKKSQKRGGGAVRVELDGISAPGGLDPDLLLDLDEALTNLTAEDRDAAELVKLRLFAGMSVTDAGRALGISRSAAYETWEFARAWFSVRGSDFGAD